MNLVMHLNVAKFELGLTPYTAPLLRHAAMRLRADSYAPRIDWPGNRAQMYNERLRLLARNPHNLRAAQ